MENCIASPHALFELGKVQEIPDDVFDAIGMCIFILILNAVIGPNEYANGRQRFDQVRADKAVTAKNQATHSKRRRRVHGLNLALPAGTDVATWRESA